MYKLLIFVIAACVFADLACNGKPEEIELLKPEQVLASDSIPDTLYMAEYRVDKTGKTVLELLMEGYTIFGTGSSKETAIEYAFPDTLCGEYVLVSEEGIAVDNIKLMNGCDQD